MRIELKKAIINFIFANYKAFNLTNLTVDRFRDYIYTKEGEYLIGGEDVYKFIKNAEILILSDGD